MIAYLGGQPVTVTVPLLDEGGSVIEATEVAYRLLDQDETELIAKAPVSDYFPGAESVVIPIDATHNALTPPNLREVRMVEVFVTNEVGTIRFEAIYALEAEQVLVEGVNSFQSYTTSVMTGCDITGLSNWNNATKAERVTALIEARRHIGRLRFRYAFDEQDRLEDTLGISDITSLTREEYLALPENFRAALRRAQVIEADYLMLGSNEVQTLRDKGVISVTVGESKHFFRDDKPMGGAICNRALKELTKWLLNRTRITRT